MQRESAVVRGKEAEDHLKAQVHGLTPAPFPRQSPWCESRGARMSLTSAPNCRGLRCGSGVGEWGRGPLINGTQSRCSSCSPSPECFWQIHARVLLGIGCSFRGLFCLETADESGMFAYTRDCFHLSLPLNSNCVSPSEFPAAGSLHPCLHPYTSSKQTYFEKTETCVLPSLEHPLTKLKPHFRLCFGSLLKMQSVSGSGGRLKKVLVLT